MKEKTGKLGISKEITIALITALSTILAAVISGVFLLYITNMSARSATTTAKNTNSATPVATTASFFPFSPSGAATPAKSSAGGSPSSATATTGPTQTLLQVYPATVKFSSCLPTEQRRIALNIINTSTSQLIWVLTSGSAYTYSLLDHSGAQITTSGFSTNTSVSIASKQTQVVLISNIQGSGTITVKSPQSAPQTVGISCAVSTASLDVAPQAMPFDACSSLNYRSFAFSVVNNSANVLPWNLASQASQTGLAFATEDGAQPGGQLQGKSTAIVLVYNIQNSSALQLASSSATSTINVNCG